MAIRLDYDLDLSQLKGKVASDWKDLVKDDPSFPPIPRPSKEDCVATVKQHIEAIHGAGYCFTAVHPLNNLRGLCWFNGIEDLMVEGAIKAVGAYRKGDPLTRRVWYATDPLPKVSIDGEFSWMLQELVYRKPGLERPSFHLMKVGPSKKVDLCYMEMLGFGFWTRDVACKSMLYKLVDLQADVASIQTILASMGGISL